MNTAAAVLARDRGGLVSTRWLLENLGAEWLRIVDVRGLDSVRDERSGPRLRIDVDPPRFVELGPRAGWQRTGSWPKSAALTAAFLAGHIPGSISLDVGRRLFDEMGTFVSGLELAMVMSEIGVGDEHTVVLVDAGRSSAALVAAWALRRHGHAETFVLGGGFPRWAAEGKPASRDVVKHPYASFTARIPS